MISYSGSHSSPTSSTPTSPPSATSRLEHRVSVFPFSQSLLSLAGCLLPNCAPSQSCFKLCFLLVSCRESSSLFSPLATVGLSRLLPTGVATGQPLGLSFETRGLRWAMLYRTSLPCLIIARIIWSEWTQSRWSPWLEAGCPLSAQQEPVNTRTDTFQLASERHSWYKMLCICSRQLFIIRYLFICAFLFVIIRSFISCIVRLLILFHSHRLFVYSLFKRKRKILILNRVQVFWCCWLFIIINTSQ